MDVEGVVDEVLEIERTLQMDMEAESGDTEVPVQGDTGQEGDVTAAEEILTVMEEGVVETVAITEGEEGHEEPETPSTEAEASPSTSTDGQDITFVVQLNDEGGIMLNKRGVVPCDAEPHVYFPITLPALKVKENPLAGATHFPTTRSRKTKPQAILYNDEIDQIYEMLPDGTLNTITTSEAVQETSSGPSTGLVETMDVIDFESRLLPKDYELMERVLANATEDLDLPHSSSKASTSREYRLDSDEVHYDHSYCAYPLYEIDKTRYKGKSKITIIPDLPAATLPVQDSRLLQPQPSEDFDVLRPIMRPDGTLGPSLWEMHTGSRDVADGEPADIGTMGEDADFVEIKTADDNPVQKFEDVKTKVQAATAHEGSASVEANARSRRSQRQQDRIERQEAERILAENQQMLQREKEMYAGKAPISPSHSGNNTTPPAPAVGVQQPVETPQSIVVPSLADTDVTTKAEVPSDETPRRPYPKRQNRKLPAHLADPNYINLDDTERKAHDDVAERESKSKAEAKEVKETTNEDDPNKLWCICQKPHNNRFMICCDTCEDWFHGKCVGITKAVGSQLDKWICPNCKKKTKNEKETLQTPVAKISRKSKTNTGSDVKRKVGSVKDTPTPTAEEKSAGQHSKRLRLSTSTSEAKDDQPQSPPDKLRQRRLTESSESTTTVSVSETPTAPGKCIICKTKQARQNSVFCSDECVVKHSQESGVPPPTTSAAASKLKRSNSKIPDKEELENFLTFHLISPGVPKSTVVVPPKPKDAAVPTTPVKSPSKIPASEPSSSNASTIGKAVNADKSSNSSASMKRGSGSEQVAPTEIKRTKVIEPARLPTKRGARSSTSSKSGSIEGKPTRKRNISGNDKSKQRETEKPEKPKKETEAEIQACRQTSRTKLTEAFELRLKELTDAERAEIPAENTPDAMSEAIEAELFNTFSTVNSKYLSRFRSILFNLKDSKNNLYKNITMNELKAKELVKLEPHQLASDELAQWRLNESKKELEMIKRSEIDKLQELKNQERIDAELGFEKIEAAIADDESRYLRMPHVDGKTKSEASLVPEPLTPYRTSSKTSTRSSPRGHRSHQASKANETAQPLKSTSETSRSKKHDTELSTSSRRTRSSDGKDKAIDKQAHTESESKNERKSDHHKSSTSRKHSSSRSSSNIHDNATKDKDKDSSSSRDKGSDRSLRSREHDLRSSDRKRSHSETGHRNESGRVDKNQSKNKKQPPPEHGSPKKGSSLEANSNLKGNSDTARNKTEGAEINKSQTPEDNDETQENSQTGATDSISTDQELPSSTIKTPDFTSEDNTVPVVDKDKEKEGQKPVLSAKFTMPELGSFHATLYNVSHFSLDGTFFPSSPVPIVGRIAPSTVWDYIDKMKKAKEVIILRLAPATPADTEGYMTFFTYFSSRTRLGVLGGISSPLKDVYLVPLDKHSPVNNALLPFHGPGLPRKRAHCLLAVVTRNYSDSLGQVSRRKLSTTNEMSTKRMKLSSEIKPGLISSLNLAGGREGRTRSSASNSTPKKSPEDKISPTDDASRISDVNEDDLPYTPWEEEEGTSPKTSNEILKSDETCESSDPKIIEQIKDIEAQILQEKTAIENISLSLIATASTKVVPLVIPGLDGEFAAEAAATAPLQFLRQLPETPAKKTEESLPVPVTMDVTSKESLSATGGKEKEAVEDDAAPYSPSQLYLDEEGTL